MNVRMEASPAPGDIYPAQRTGRPTSVGQLSEFCVANLDHNLLVLEANAEFLNYLGRSAADVYGRTFSKFVHPSVERLVTQHLAGLRAGTRDRFTTRMLAERPSYTVASGMLTGIAVRKAGGEVSGIVVLLRPDRAHATAPPSESDQRKTLSELDARVLEGIATGISTARLATKLYLSRQGIEYHVSAMLRRFKSPNRSALVSKAYAQGILPVGQWPPKVSPENIH